MLIALFSAVCINLKVAQHYSFILLRSIDFDYWNHYKLSAQRGGDSSCSCLCVAMYKGITSKMSKVHVNITNKISTDCGQKLGYPLHINVNKYYF